MKSTPRVGITPVAAGVLRREGLVFLGKRKNDSLLEGLWEFPGGKLKFGENPETALKRELFEELNVAVRVESLLHADVHEYPDRSIFLMFYWCRPGGEPAPRPSIYEETLWVPLKDVPKIQMPEANDGVKRAIVRHLERNGR